MKKLILLLVILAVGLSSCEVPTGYESVIVDVVDDPEDDAIIEPSPLIGRWLNGDSVMEFLDDGSFNYYSGGVLQNYGYYEDYHYEYPENSYLYISLYDIDYDVWYLYLIIDGYPGAGDVSINLVVDGGVSAVNWVKE